MPKSVNDVASDVMLTPSLITSASPRAAESEPRVTISGGDLRLGDQEAVQTTPGGSGRPGRRAPRRTTTPSPSPPMAAISLAEITDEKTSTEPMDRSIPEVMMTKVMPTPSTAIR